MSNRQRERYIELALEDEQGTIDWFFEKHKGDAWEFIEDAGLRHQFHQWVINHKKLGDKYMAYLEENAMDAEETNGD